MKRPETNPEDGEDILEKAKSKLIMDFGLDQAAPERVTIEVLQQLIKEKPDRMCQAVRRWLHNQRPEN
jgi:flagellar biosynthesis/type III secretory pathway M-ring protein FliF/YscJ